MMKKVLVRSTSLGPTDIMPPSTQKWLAFAKPVEVSMVEEAKGNVKWETFFQVFKGEGRLSGHWTDLFMYKEISVQISGPVTA